METTAPIETHSGANAAKVATYAAAAALLGAGVLQVTRVVKRKLADRKARKTTEQ